MKKRICLMLTLMLAAGSLLVWPNSKQPNLHNNSTEINLLPVAGAQTGMTCSQAFQACDAQMSAEQASCVALEENFTGCFCRAAKIFNSCMKAHGCPSGMINFEVLDCPSN